MNTQENVCECGNPIGYHNEIGGIKSCEAHRCKCDGWKPTTPSPEVTEQMVEAETHRLTSLCEDFQFKLSVIKTIAKDNLTQTANLRQQNAELLAANGVLKELAKAAFSDCSTSDDTPKGFYLVPAHRMLDLRQSQIIGSYEKVSEV